MSHPGDINTHPAQSLSARSDIVSPGTQPLWPGRHCLTRHTASLAGQTHPAVRPSGRPAGRPTTTTTTATTTATTNLIPRQGPRGGTRVSSVTVVACSILPQPLFGRITAQASIFEFRPSFDSPHHGHQGEGAPLHCDLRSRRQREEHDHGSVAV